MGQEADIEDMAFFRNILSSKRVDTDMEAGHNHSDVELDEMEAGSGPAHYPQPAAHYPQPAAHYPHSLSDLESIPLLPLSNIPAMDSMVGMQSDTNQKLLSSNRENIERDLESCGHTSIYPPLLPPSNIPAMDTMVGIQSDTNQKRSWHQDQSNCNKVRIVTQTSRIPKLVGVRYL